MKPLDWFKAAALLALTFALVESGLFVRRASIEFTKFTPIADKLTKLTSDADQTVLHLDKTAGVLNDAAKQQAEYWPKELQETRKVTAAAKELIVRTDLSLNGGPSVRGVLPGLTGAIGTTNDAIEHLTADIDSTHNQISPVLDNLALSTDAMAKQTPVILQNLQETSKQTVLVSENVAGTTDELHGTATDIHAYIHRETTPARGTWNLIKSFLVRFAGPSANVVTATRR